MTNKNNNYRLLYLLSAFISCFPLFLCPSDVWDGVIAKYAYKLNRYEGMELWLLDSRWVLQYGLYRVMFLISHSTGMSLEWLVDLTISVSLIGASKEVGILIRDKLKLSQNTAYVGAVVFLSQQYWCVLSSSVMFMHILCLYLLLLGCRMYFGSTSSKYKYSGLIVLILSSQLNSNIVMIMGMFPLYAVIHKNTMRQFLVNHWIIPVLVLCLVLFKLLFPPIGLYQGYNKIIAFDTIYDYLNGKSTLLNSLKCLANNLFTLQSHFLSMFTTFPFNPVAWVYGKMIPPFSFFCLITVIGFLFFCKDKTAFKKDNRTLFYSIIFLYVSSISAYLLAGKSPTTRGYSDWSYRQAILCAIPFCLFVVLSLKTFTSTAQKKYTRKFFSLCLWFSIGLSFFYLYLGYQCRVEQKAVMMAFMNDFSKQAKPKSGFIQMKTSERLPMILRVSELNSMLHDLYGESNWFAEMGEESILAYEQKAIYSLKNIINADKSHLLFHCAADFKAEKATLYSVKVIKKNNFKLLSWAYALGLSENPYQLIFSKESEFDFKEWYPLQQSNETGANLNNT